LAIRHITGILWVAEMMPKCRLSLSCCSSFFSRCHADKKTLCLEKRRVYTVKKEEQKKKNTINKNEHKNAPYYFLGKQQQK
jgi:beta-lactamase regulating signal transducer with metallopeptidase domain